ncbi:transcriptional repressor [bacterium]|nr:transcriptional repressor [bacterium]
MFAIRKIRIANDLQLDYYPNIMMEQKIKQSGYKLTKPRELVLKTLQNTHEPICAQEIHKKLNKKVDLASIYRTLNLFVSIGIAFKEIISEKDLYYLAKKQHHHVICTKCGYSECIPCNHLFKNIKNFTNISHNITISGICKKCS